MSRHFVRRDLLKGAGMGALLSALPMLRNARAFAATGAIPKRVLFIYSMTGNLPTHPSKAMRAPGNWEPLAPAGMSGDPTETAWDLNTTMAPLNPYKKDLILFENLDDAQSLIDPTAPDSGHHAGGTTALTGANRMTKELPGAISIDQLIAQKLNSPSPITRLPSLDLACGTDNGSYISEAFATGPGQVVPRLFEPADVYARAFPDGSVAGNAGDQAAAMRLANMRNREFDFLGNQGKLLSDRVGANDRTKIQQHLDTLSDLRQRLSLTTGVSAASVPPKSILDAWKNTPHGYNDMFGNGAKPTQAGTVWSLNFDINSQIAVAALAADVTRVASILVTDPPDNAFGLVPSTFGVFDGHDLQHKVNNVSLPFYTNPDARATLQRAHLLVMNKVKSVLDQLAMRTESDGKRLLDHTLVVYTSQIANGNHDLTNLPWFTAGNVDGYFKTGRYLRFQRDKKAFAPAGSNVGRPHNDLLVSVANAVGVPLTTFGNASVCGGPLNEMRG